MILTDTTDAVLNLLRRNVEMNLSPASLRLNDAAWALDMIGSARVEELDWIQPDHVQRANPPVDIVVAADCVYSEKAVPYFLNVVRALSSRKTMIVIANEFRCARVHELFMSLFGRYFTIKKVPSNRMDEAFRHPLIQIYLLKQRRESDVKEGDEGSITNASKAVDSSVDASHQRTLEVLDRASEEDSCVGGRISVSSYASRSLGPDNGEASRYEEHVGGIDEPETNGSFAEPSSHEHLAADWKSQDEDTKDVRSFKTRRKGAELARMLKDVHLE